MTAPHLLISYRGIDGTRTYLPVREKGRGWLEFYAIRNRDPTATLYMIRQEGYP